jgi:dUTP pyrophosphatase
MKHMPGAPKLAKPMKLKFKKLRPDAITPTRGSAKASGLDLYAIEDYTIPFGKTVRVEVGIAFGIPEGYEIQVRPRSGLSLKTDLRVANTPGTVDADYTGDCSVILHNTGGRTYEVKRGDRVGQAVLCPVVIPELEEVEELSSTARGASGFGSTGR